MSHLDVQKVRAQFPALSRQMNGKPLVFFDAPAGTQVPKQCISGVSNYFKKMNANTHGAFITAIESDKVIEQSHTFAADFLNAKSAQEVFFGANMTTLTFAFSRSIGQTLKEGDEIILSSLDHDANFSPWHLMAQERGVKVNVVDVNQADCTLNLDDFERYLNSKTKLVAVGLVSNAVGTINPVKQIIGMAHAAGAMTFIDAVAGAPHVPIDVQELDTDFLACSPYKFWAPHLGIIYGKKHHLEKLPAYKVRPSDNALPNKFETGTKPHELLAGFNGTMKYLDWFAKNYGVGQSERKQRSPRAERFRAAMRASQAYEAELSERMIAGLKSIAGVRIYGITDPARMSQRAPTFAIRYKDEHPRATAERLAAQGICVWDGNYYALNLTERLGVEESGGMVRIGLSHYSSAEEVDRFLNAL
jgi:cysteine desulfurase family protein (TIGR01976 family)